MNKKFRFSAKGFGCLFLVFFCFLISTSGAWGGEVRVAVASNFLNPLKEIAKRFEAQTGHRVHPIPGSTGKLYAQIVQGAPFDILLAADSKRPRLLVEKKNAVAGSRFTYARGKLVLWSNSPEILPGGDLTSLGRMNFKRLAMANPKTAPYGMASRQTLEKLKLWGKLRKKVVRGENIGQTFQFVLSGNAELGFVSLSQVLDPKNETTGRRWEVPGDYHDALEQDAVLLARGRNNPAANAFLKFMKGKDAGDVILSYGYELP